MYAQAGLDAKAIVAKVLEVMGRHMIDTTIRRA
jgi:hypothetical protein